MVQQKSLVTNEKPVVVIDDANGDLRLMGWERSEVLAKVEGDLTLQQDDDKVVHLRCNGDSVVRIPFSASLSLIQAHGDVRIKSVNGQVKIGSSTGDLALRHVGAVQLDNLAGDASIKHVSGNLQVNNIDGDLSVLDVHAVTITNVSCDFSARAVQGTLVLVNAGSDASLEGIQGNVVVENAGNDLHIAGVQGNVKIGKSGNDLSISGVQGRVDAGQVLGDLNANGVLSITAAAMGDATISFLSPLGPSDVKASGDITARFMPETNASVHITSAAASITVNAPGGGRTLEEGSYELKLGTGDVSVSLNAMGDVSVMSHAPGAEQKERGSQAFDFDFDFNFENHIGDFGFGGMGERIGQRAREAAERATANIQEKVQAKVERATRKAEEQIRRAEHQIRRTDRRGPWSDRRPNMDDAWRTPVPPTPPTPPREPVSDEERMTILRMLENKKITAAQAEQLLSAISGKGA